jgi:hypothetical protein
VDSDTWLYLTLTPLYGVLVAGGGADEWLAHVSILKTSSTPDVHDKWRRRNKYSILHISGRKVGAQKKSIKKELAQSGMMLPAHSKSKSDSRSLETVMDPARIFLATGDYL